MINPIRNLLVILIGCTIHLYSSSLMAQRSMIGLEYGYGRSQMTSHKNAPETAPNSVGLPASILKHYEHMND